MDYMASHPRRLVLFIVTAVRTSNPKLLFKIPYLIRMDSEAGSSVYLLNVRWGN
jgi:hypothetical protein